MLNERSFERFFKESFVVLAAHLRYKFGLDDPGARDFAHQAFVRLWENRSTLQDGPSSKSYLFKVADNLVIDELRRNKKAEAFQRDFQVEDTYNFGEVDAKELALAIRSAINDLPPEMRRIFELSRFEGLKYAEIAAKLAISPKTVETQISRALNKLRLKLAPYLGVLIVATFASEKIFYWLVRV